MEPASNNEKTIEVAIPQLKDIGSLINYNNPLLQLENYIKERDAAIQDAIPPGYELAGSLSKAIVDQRAETLYENACIVIIGNLTEGHQFFGPFPDFDTASEWADKRQCDSPSEVPDLPGWICSLESPQPFELPPPRAWLTLKVCKLPWKGIPASERTLWFGEVTEGMEAPWQDDKGLCLVRIWDIKQTLESGIMYGIGNIARPDEGNLGWVTADKFASEWPVGHRNSK